MKKSLKDNLFNTFFNTDSKTGIFFDVLLLIVIAISVVVVLLDSVPDKIPFRRDDHIRDLFAEIDIPITDIYTSYSCMVAQLQ